MERLIITALLAVTVLFSTNATASASCLPADYQVGQRPGAADAPTRIQVGLTLVDLLKVDDLQQTVTLDVVLNLRWQDPRLADRIGCRYTLQQIWHPEIQLMNSGELIARQPLELTMGPQGWLEGGVRLRGRVTDPRSMAAFPFDSHTFELQVMSLRYKAEEVAFQVADQWTLRSPTLSVPDWRIGDVSARVENVILPQLGRLVSTYRYRIPGERVPQYYVYKIILPLILIVFMSWAVFWIDPQSLGPQMALAGTSMLTLITFQFTMNDLLPRVGYFTQLDKFILSASLLVFLALAEAVTSGYFASHDKRRLASRLDRLSRVAFPAVFAVITLLTLVH